MGRLFTKWILCTRNCFTKICFSFSLEKTYCVIASKSIFEGSNLSSELQFWIDPAPGQSHCSTSVYRRLIALAGNSINEFWLLTLVHSYIQVATNYTSLNKLHSGCHLCPPGHWVSVCSKNAYFIVQFLGNREHLKIDARKCGQLYMSFSDCG